jgi:hypothetical protein
MYSNPKHLHDKEVKVRFNTDDHRDLLAVAEMLGMQPAVLAREATNKYARELLASDEQHRHKQLRA